MFQQNQISSRRAQVQIAPSKSLDELMKFSARMYESQIRVYTNATKNANTNTSQQPLKALSINGRLIGDNSMAHETKASSSSHNEHFVVASYRHGDQQIDLEPTVAMHNHHSHTHPRSSSSSSSWWSSSSSSIATNARQSSCCCHRPRLTASVTSTESIKACATEATKHKWRSIGEELRQISEQYHKYLMEATRSNQSGSSNGTTTTTNQYGRAKSIRQDSSRVASMPLTTIATSQCVRIASSLLSSKWSKWLFLVCVTLTIRTARGV